MMNNPRMDREVEEIAGHLNAADRLRMAQKLVLWAKQIQASVPDAARTSPCVSLARPCARLLRRLRPPPHSSGH